jgi:hypothetical protein
MPPALFAAWLTGAILFFTIQLFFWYRAVRQASYATLPNEQHQSEWQ